jgi:hypothetical protein
LKECPIKEVFLCLFDLFGCGDIIFASLDMIFGQFEVGFCKINA